MNAPALETLLYEVRAGTAWLTLNRPARCNALDPALLQSFAAALDAAANDAAVRSVCVTGAGPRVFCAGLDLDAVVPGAAGAVVARQFADVLRALLRFSKPVVALLNGDCLAGGLGLMLAADLVYAHPGVALGTPEVSVGLFPMMVAALLVRHGPPQRVLEMVYTARRVPAFEAATMGLITRVVPAAELAATVDDVLADINRQAPLALARGRAALWATAHLPLDVALGDLCEALIDLYGSDDATEGRTAFRERRAPVWQGR